MIAMTKAYRTCSTMALQVLAGAMPLDLVLDARLAHMASSNPSRVCVPLRPELQAILEGGNQDCPAAIVPHGQWRSGRGAGLSQTRGG